MFVGIRQRKQMILLFARFGNYIFLPLLSFFRFFLFVFCLSVSFFCLFSHYKRLLVVVLFINQISLFP